MIPNPNLIFPQNNLSKDAIRNEINIELLKQVIQNDSDSGVIDVARNRIQEIQPNYAHNL